MHSSRYFVNKFADFPGTVGDISYVRGLIPEVLKHIEKRCPPQSRQNKDGGLYVGPAGVAYAFYYVADSGLFPEQRQYLLAKALEYLKVVFLLCFWYLGLVIDDAWWYDIMIAILYDDSGTQNVLRLMNSRNSGEVRQINQET